MKSRGFTLVELLVVVTILSVLGMVGLSIFRGTTQNSADQTRQQQIANFKGALELYRNELRSYPKTLVEITPAYLESVPTDPRGRSYQYLALPDSCTSAQRNCLGYVICAKKDGNQGFDLPSACSALACGGSAGDCDLGLAEGEVSVAAVPIPTLAPPPTLAPIPTATSTPVPPTPTPNPFPTSGLTAYWKLDEASGTRVGYIGGNMSPQNGSVSSGVGKINNAAQFSSGVNAWLTTPDSNAVSGGGSTQSRTYAAWVYLTNKNTRSFILSKYYSGGAKEMVLLYDLSTGLFQFSVSSDGYNDRAVEAVPLGSPELNRWYLIIAWFDNNNNTIGIQVNNGASRSESWSPGIFNGPRELAIGNRNGGGNSWNGLIDAVGIWNRALSPAERTLLYNGGSGLQP